MKDKKTVVLDLTGCKSLSEMHLRIRDAFRFPDSYGHNWDAFWDLMRTECDAERIVVRGRDTVPESLAPSVETLFRLLYTADGYFTQVIGRAGIEILDESPPADDEEDGRTEAEKNVVLDLTGCKSLGEMHLRIRDAFHFPDFYGQNWDAFWDLIRTECDAERIVVRGGNTVPQDLAPSVEMLYRLLREANDDGARYGEQAELEIQG